MCSACSIAFPLERIGAVVNAGKCVPAVAALACDNEVASHPGAIKLAQPILIGGHKAHESHQIWRLRDVFFCSVCGSWARQVPRQLIKPCSSKADTRGRYVLARLEKQLPPRTDMVWD